MGTVRRGRGALAGSGVVPDRGRVTDPSAALVVLYASAAADLDAWLRKHRDITVGAEHVKSARRQILRRIEELESA